MVIGQVSSGRAWSTAKPWKDAVRLSEEKYRSVAAMLNKTAKISWKIELDEKIVAPAAGTGYPISHA
jgi:hypothetical protein